MIYCFKGTEDTSIANFKPTIPFFSIDQVPFTYGYTMGAYGIQVLYRFLQLPNLIKALQ